MTSSASLHPRVSRRHAALIHWLLAAWILVFPRLAWAQAGPQLQVQTDGPVGVGDIVHFVLSATSADTMPTDARLSGAGAFVVRGQSPAPFETHMVVNGARSDQYTLTMTWSLEAKRIGSFRVGPASVQMNGRRYSSEPVTIQVVAAGQGARRPSQPQMPPGMQSPFGFSPFDLWKGLLRPSPDDLERPTPEVTPNPKLALDAPRGSLFFFHATIDKSSVVVGEQVTYSVLLYVDPSAEADLRGEDHDPAVPDFAKQPLLREDQEAPDLGYATVGGRPWRVVLVRRWALFPLRTGDLGIGAMRRELPRRGGANVVRASESFQVHVSEPPAAKRPPGYVVGDVGRFSIGAEVSPRQIEQGGAISVRVEVKGAGNIPSAVEVPARDGVEWLAPEVHDELGPLANNGFGGRRTLQYVVRVRRAGAVDLGEMALPFWDPDQRRYEVARATLGTVQVTPVPGAAEGPLAAPLEVLPGLPAPRDVLEGSPRSGSHPDDSPLFWLAGVASWPLAFGLAVAGRSAGRRIAGALRQRKNSPAADLRERLSAADVACRERDPRRADAAIARALAAAAIAHAGVSVRGVLGDEVVGRLEQAGVAPGAAADVAGLLRECEAARFAPEAADIDAARARWSRAQGAIRAMEKGA